MKRIQNVAHGLAAAFGAVLLLAAGLKAADPTAPLLALRIAGLSGSAADWVLSGINTAETLIGAVLLFGSPGPRVLRASAIFGLVALLGHRILRVLIDGSSCGCFGAVSMPDGTIHAILVVGGLSCAVAGWNPAGSKRAASSRAWRLATIGALTLSAAGVTLSASGQGESTLARSAVQAQLPGPAVVIIGSPDCGQCRTLVDGAAHWTTGEADRQCVVFYPRSKAVTKPASAGLRFETLPDLAWFELAQPKPPAVYHWDGHQLRRADAPWQARIASAGAR